MTSVRRILIASALALAGLGLVTTPASASTPAETIYQPPTPYSNDYSFDPECPGVPLWVDGHNSGTAWSFNVPGSHGQAFLGNDQYSFREVWKNTRTGRWFTIQGSGFFQEYSAVRVPIHQIPPDLVPPGGVVGPVYLFKSLDTGTQAWIKNAHGKTVLKDHGQIYSKNLFDTLGDHAPGGNSLLYENYKIVGPHPIYYADICKVAKRLTT